MSRTPAGIVDLASLFDAAADRMRAVLTAADDYRDALDAIGPDTPPEPRWNQDWFPGLDALVAYVMVRQSAPGRILEVGAGHSTRFLARAIRDGGLGTRFTSVDPAPRAAVAGLAGHALIKARLQDIPAALLAEWRAGDLLFVDSSHILAPGSDVEHLMTRVLPDLPAETLVHFHDIFLPDGYPAHWEGRRYNEQDAIARLLQTGDWRIEFASAYLRRHRPEALVGTIAAGLPLVDGAIESSLWLRRLSR